MLEKRSREINNPQRVKNKASRRREISNIKRAKNGAELRRKRLDQYRARAARMDWRPQTPENWDKLSALKYLESKMGSLLEQGKNLENKKKVFTKLYR
jgi:hypothetical protein